jgi:hypothetical protein
LLADRLYRRLPGFTEGRTMWEEDEHRAWEQQRNWQFHRTLVEFLLQSRQPEVAAALLEGSVEIVSSRKVGKPDILYVDIPPAAYPLVGSNEELQQVVRRAVREVARGHLDVDPQVELRMQLLLSPDPGWEEEMKGLILQFKGSNQALVTDLIAAREGRPTHTWNELKYASASEIRIAQELERRRVLFFPLAVGVRADTGKNWQDHREVDFLVCHKGAWGILEVSYHPDRYEQDAEKDVWFKRSGLLCIQHYTAERCSREPAKVVDEFMGILTQYEK